MPICEGIIKDTFNRKKSLVLTFILHFRTKMFPSTFELLFFTNADVFGLLRCRKILL